MAEPKKWNVAYTAKRKVTRYEHRNLSIQVTEHEVRKLLDMKPLHDFDTVDPNELREALEEIATDRGHFESEAWDGLESENEDLDPVDFEITETP
jgi:hypothetical protein